MNDKLLPSSKRRKNNQAIEEEYPILNQEDFKTSINNLADLPDYLERINQNILNIDKRISKKEIQTDKVREFAKNNPANEYKHHKNDSLTNIKDLVKQSVDGINDIFKSQQPMPEPQPEPYQQHHLSNPSDRNKNFANNVRSVVVKSNTNEEKTIPEKKNSHKTMTAGKENKETNKKSFKIDISKFSTNTNVNPTIDNTDNKPNSSYYHRDKNKDLNKDKNINNVNTQGNKPNFNNDNLVKKSIVNQIKEREKSKSPVGNKNYFPFKPKNSRKDMSGNEISIDNDNEKSLKNNENKSIQPHTKVKPVSAVHKNNNNVKQLYTNPNSSLNKVKEKSKINNTEKDKQSEKVTNDTLEMSINSSKKTPQPQKKQPKAQLDYQHEQNQLQPSSHTLPKRQQISNNKSPNLYSKEMPKEAGTIDLLQMMLFFNEYIISHHNIKDFAFHQDTFKQYSTMITSLLNQGKQVIISKNNIIEEESIKSKNVILIQRIWRSYKFKSFIPENQTINEVLMKIIINNFIVKEGFNSRKIIGMFNESLDLFSRIKSKHFLIIIII